MKEAGTHHGDLLIVDANLSPSHRKIVIALSMGS
ncbi:MULTISPECIES: hypothetical protein [Legionella]|nr:MULTISPECIES: hypothetical protein [Legionella]